MKRSTKEVIFDETLNYTNVVDYFDNLIRDYINSNKGHLKYVKRYLIAYVINNTTYENPAKTDDVISEFISLDRSNIEKKIGLSPNDPELDTYLAIKEEIMKSSGNLQTLLGQLKTRVGFIGFRRVGEKGAYFFKTERALDFEKRFPDKTPDARNLKKVLLNLLERS